jgi:hypothetical protein
VPSSWATSATVAHDAQPLPNGPAATNRDEYVRVQRSTASRSGRVKSSSASTKCPVAVHTGSATNPEVRGIRAAQVASTVTGARSANNTAGSIPAARHTASKHAAKAASSTVRRIRSWATAAAAGSGASIASAVMSDFNTAVIEESGRTAARSGASSRARPCSCCTRPAPGRAGSG